MKLIEQVHEVLSEKRGAVHVDDIAILLVERYPNLKVDLNELPAKVSSALSQDIKKNGRSSAFSKPKNKQGGFQRGMYKAKTKKKVEAEATEQPSVSTQFKGQAGENAVISELLFFGYNASAMAVDDGIDVVASKDNNYFHIQVKTANSSKDGYYTFTITRKIFSSKHSSQTFYILVMRVNGTNRHFNDYVVLPSSEIKRLVQIGAIKDGEKYSLRVSRNNQGHYLLNNSHDITNSINQFGEIL